MTAPPTSGTSDATQPGLYHAYALVAAASLTAGATLVTITVPGPGWFDVETTVENWSATVGTIAQDSMNFVLESDPVTAATMKVARLHPANPFIFATPAIPRVEPVRTRVFAQSTLTIVALQAATASTSWLGTITAREVFVPTDAV